MRKSLLFAAVAMLVLTALTTLLPPIAAAGCGGFSPGGCEFPLPPADPVGPSDLCVGDAVCQPVAYQWVGRFYLATSALPSGYGVIGWDHPGATRHPSLTKEGNRQRPPRFHSPP